RKCWTESPVPAEAHPNREYGEDKADSHRAFGDSGAIICSDVFSPLFWTAMNEVTRILDAIGEGDPSAASRLLPLVYDELRRLAAQKLAREPQGQTLQPTALVHEAYLRLVGNQSATQAKEHWDNPGPFFAAAAEAMRRILVENARRRRSLKRGGELARQELDEAILAAPEPREDLVALDEALNKLAAADSTAAQLVQLRYFAGLAIPEAAQVLGVSPRTADRLWAYARAWLHQEMEGGTQDESLWGSQKRVSIFGWPGLSLPSPGSTLAGASKTQPRPLKLMLEMEKILSVWELKIRGVILIQISHCL